jgi:uncharacterized membrane protein
MSDQAAAARLTRWRLGLVARLRAYFIAGVLVTAPIGVTIYLAWLVVGYIDQTVTLLLPAGYDPRALLPFSVPGLGLVIALVAITLIGAFAAGYIGRILLVLGEGIVSRTPFLRGIYGATKQLFEAVLATKSTAFREVVLVEFPRKDMWSIGFVTGSHLAEAQATPSGALTGVFVPTTPVPTSGYLVYLPPSEMVKLDMSIEDGLKLVVSGGVVTPPMRRSGERLELE